MRKFHNYVFALALALCVASCGGDSDDDDGNGNGNTGDNTETTVKPDKMGLTVTLNEPGTLVEKIDAAKKYTTASLKVKGAHPTNPVEGCADANPKTVLPNDT